MNKTTSSHCVRVLRSLFARHGLLLKVLSDNGPQFISEEMEGLF